MSETYNPWTPEPRVPQETFGQALLILEDMMSAKGNAWKRILISAVPLRVDFDTIERSEPVFASQYTEIVLPSLQELVRDNSWFDFPYPDGGGKVADWEFWASWKMAVYPDFRQNSVDYFTKGDPPDRAPQPERVQKEEKTGRLYIERNTFEFMQVFPTEAACIAAHEAKYGNLEGSEEIPGFDAPDTGAVSEADRQFLNVFIGQAFHNTSVMAMDDLKQALSANNLPFDMGDGEIVSSMIEYLVVYNSGKNGGEKELNAMLNENPLTAGLTAKSPNVAELIKTAGSPF